MKEDLQINSLHNQNSLFFNNNLLMQLKDIISIQSMWFKFYLDYYCLLCFKY